MEFKFKQIKSQSMQVSGDLENVMAMVMWYLQMARNIEATFILDNSTVTVSMCGPSKHQRQFSHICLATATLVIGSKDLCMVVENFSMQRVKY